MLVAALAAGDLAGTERDQAINLTRSCTECAALHDDLVAIARATATLPAPATAAGRDFQLTPDQAAALRRTGWRRFIPSFGGANPLIRPLGITLATFGIAGLLVGTLPLGSPAVSPSALPAAGGASAAAVENLGAGDRSGAGQPGPSVVRAPAVAPAASAAASAVPAASSAFSGRVVSASPSGAPVTTRASQDRETTSDGVAFGPVQSASAPGGSRAALSAAGTGEPKSAASTEVLAGTTSDQGPGWSPLVGLSLAALLVGIGLLIVSRRRPAASR
jgi:hypothetical protein